MKINQRGAVHLIALFILVAGLIIGVYLVGQELNFIPKAYLGKTDFYGKQINILKVFGQSKLSETSRNIVTGNAIYHAGGVVVDKSHPYEADKVYVVDGGNNRVLGFNGIGTCSNDRRACTADKNCNGGTCRINTGKNADIVIGQPDFQSGACNLDNNLGIFKRPGPDTLCLMAYPVAANTAESWTRSNFDVDNEGNLYITDASNNRVLKYNQPLSMDKSGGRGDAVADFVIGQQDFNSNGINGSQLVSHRLGQVPPPNRNSLYLSGGDFGATTTGGISTDKEGNIWIADIFNNRVLRLSKGSKEADLVIGQTDFTTRGSINCFDGSSHNPGNIPLDRLCVPTVAKVNPDTGDLYVLDEYSSPFIARILLFKPPFTNGMRASKIIIPGGGPGIGEFGNKYLFQSSGFAFNTFKQGEYERGVLWVNEHQTNRTVLIDNDGNIIQSIGIIKPDLRGGDTQYGGECGNIDARDEYNLWWPGGSIGFDSDNNIYLADEFFKRISRYSLPYNFRRVGNSFCLPKASDGLLKGFSANIEGDNKLGESVGLTIYRNQLIVRDEAQRFKVWNDYQGKPVLNPTPDLVIKGQLSGRNLLSDSVDPFGRLWLFNEHGQIMIYQLPFRGNDQPIKNFVKLYWADTREEIPYRGSGSISFDKRSGGIYITDTENNRILRSTRWVELFNSPDNRLYIDSVIGQPDKQTTACNQGRGEKTPSAEGLCVPTQVKFDKQGNMYVVENTYECHGNNRISVFQAPDLVNNRNLFPNLSAKHVFISKSLTQQAACSDNKLNEPSSPVSLAFNSKNQMIVANDGSYGGYGDGNPDKRYKRQLWFYRDPLRFQMPDAYIDLPMGAPGEIAFDDQDNLLIQDHTWYRIWMINLDKDPLWFSWLAAVPALPINPGNPPINPPSPIITPSPSPSPRQVVCTACGADINKDSFVNTNDFGRLKSCFGKKPEGSCLNADINGDGKIDTTGDFTCFQAELGKQCIKPFVCNACSADVSKNDPYGNVNINDFSKTKYCLNEKSTTLKRSGNGVMYCAQVDINDDGQVDLTDLECVKSQFGSQCKPPLPTPSPIPTPVSSTPLPISAFYSRVFVTSATYNGNLGGLSGADAKCQERAAAVRLRGRWKAWLSDTNTSAADRLLHVNVPYRLLNGTTIANSWSDLTNNVLQAPINITELNTTLNNTSNVWTNTSATGIKAGQDPSADGYSSCNNWTATSFAGIIGSTQAKDSNWSRVTGYGSDTCRATNPLYCFEQ